MKENKSYTLVKMQDVGITELRTIVGWTYPTALKFAKENGTQNDAGKWAIPFNKVAGLVQGQVAHALRMQSRLFDFEDSHKI